jgi:SAM-dependent methyltransferase
MSESIERKKTFNLVPELYDEIRPHYPLSILQQIEDYAHLTPDSKLVEIGPGTGQASDYFIRQGYSFLGIELGVELAAFAQRKYAGHANAAFIEASFEDWHGENRSFDLFLAAQSFHWIDVDFGLRKAANVLKQKGVIALLWNLDESQHTEFWKRGSSVHNEYFPDESSASRLTLLDWSKEYAESLQESQLFDDTRVVEHKWQRAYSADEWIRMRNTFSPDLSLPPARKEEFHGKLKALIEELGGSFTRYYRCVSVLGRCL